MVSADGSHGGPAEIHLDLLAHQPTVLRTVDLKLDPGSMLRVDEQRPGDIRVVFLRDSTGAVLADAAKEVNILAANQWKATPPPQLALEMLAAYIQPNAAVISGLMLEISDRLQASTENSSIDGYQSESPRTGRRDCAGSLRCNEGSRHPLRRAAGQLGGRHRPEGAHARRGA